MTAVFARILVTFVIGACAVACGGSGSAPRTGALCGNGARDPGEQCDGMDLAGATCVEIERVSTGGSLGCRDDCTYDLTGCEGEVCLAAGKQRTLIIDLQSDGTAMSDFTISGPASDDYAVSGTFRGRRRSPTR